MATLIPAFSIRSQQMTAGERRFARRLEDKLEDDYLLWYDVPIGPKGLHPDFIVLHPLRGIYVLEVKDWKLDTIAQMDRATATLNTPDGVEISQHPLEQARGYALAIKNLLERDKHLCQAEGRYQGKLSFPCNYGVVLSNITRKQFEATQLGDVIDSHLVICRDEMFESVDEMEFQQRLWNFSTYEFGEPLTQVEIDRIRWHIFPEVRIEVKQLSLLDDQSDHEVEEEEVIPSILRVMDLQQEQLARSMGDGHRVVHGVAGSGKTLILVYRCLHLLEQSTKPILVLCFNVALAAKLRQMLHEKGVAPDRVVVRSFHRWCSDLLWQYRVTKPSYNQFPGDAYYQELVQRVIQAIEAGKIPAGMYGSVLIDEGHDFQPEWLKLAVQMVDPETKSLLLLYDDAQTIYEKQKKRAFSFKSVGIEAQGRTTILKINYRNTQEVLTLAYEFAKEMLTPIAETDDDVPTLVKPESAGRKGGKPELIRLPSFKREVDYLVERSRQLHERGTAWNDMAIVYRSKFMAEQTCQAFQAAEIPIEWINRDSNSRHYHPAEQSIKLVTMHSSKGLEFPVVFIPGIGFMPTQNVPQSEEARLLYVAMTRAIDQLVLTCDRPSEFVQQVEAALARV